MLNSLEITKLKNDLREKGWFLFKSAETVQLAKQARQEYFSNFNQYVLQAKGFSYSELQREPIRKQNISSSNGVGEPYSQALQATYFPEKTLLPSLAEIFRILYTTRNQVTGKPIAYGTNPITDKYWNACRIHHYPSGGGFMMKHRDTHFTKILGDMDSLQCLFLLSTRGEDFQTGGGFIEDLQGNRIDLEGLGGIGSLFFFDGRIPHGVDDIDRGHIFSFSEKSGRLAAIANLYEYYGE